MESQVNEKNEVKAGVSLAEAKKYLQKNDLSEIAAELNLKRPAVSNVLHGRSKNFKVVQKIIERAQANKSIMDQVTTIQ